MTITRINPTAPFHPRNGAEKRLTIPQPAPGHRSRIAPSHPYLHGAPADTTTPAKSHTQPVALHPSTTAKQTARATLDASGALTAAAKLGEK